MSEDHGRLGKLPKIKKSGKILHYKDPKTGVVHAVSRGSKKKSVMVNRGRSGLLDTGERVEKKLKKKDPYRTEQRRQTKDYKALKKLRKKQQEGFSLDTILAEDNAREVIARRGKKKTFKESQAKFRQGRRTR